MDKKGFSLVEIIFALMAISIIITIAVSKFDLALSSTNINKIKSDIVQIRAGINKYKNRLILQNNTSSFQTLGDSEVLLFNTILKNPIKVSQKQKTGSWSKVSQNRYKVFIDSTDSLEFIFDNSKYTFDCDIKDKLCKDLNL